MLEAHDSEGTTEMEHVRVTATVFYSERLIENNFVLLFVRV